MAYEHATDKGTYVLYTREVELKGGRRQTIYFFSKKGNTPPHGRPTDVPPGKEVAINARTGLPYLRNATSTQEKEARAMGTMDAAPWQQRVTAEQLSNEVHFEATPQLNVAATADLRVAIHAEISESTLRDRPSGVDRLGFQPYVQGLARFLTSADTKPPLSVSIEGAWGQGKSSFLQQLEHQIRTSDPDAVVFWFNPWQHQTKASLWASFATKALDEVMGSASKQTRTKQNLRRWLQAARPKLPLALAAGLSSAAAATLAYTLLDSLPQHIQAMGAGSIPVASLLAFASKRLANWRKPVQWSIDEHISRQYAGYVDFQATFKDSYAEILATYSEGRRIYAMIDDLDRCSPEQSAHLMEAMHHLTADNSDIIFVLGIDYDKVAAGLGHQHLQELGAGTLDWPEYARTSLRMGRHFLEKLIQLRFIVPLAGAQQLTRLVQPAITVQVSQSEMMGFSTEGEPTPSDVDEAPEVFVESQFVVKEIERVAPHLDFNPRRILHFLNAFRLQCALAKELGLFADGVRPSQLATWTVLATRHPRALRTIIDDPPLLQFMTEVAMDEDALNEGMPENIRELLLDASLSKLLASHDNLGPQEAFPTAFVNRVARLNVRDGSEGVASDDVAQP